jgi:regulator of protease activity HflC (stomatin/prohibitin superfamily)
MEKTMSPKAIKRTIIYGIIGLFAVIGLVGTIYVVPEGHVAVVKYTGKAVRQENPGLQFKKPILEDYEIVEVRERKNVEEMNVATGNQLPATAIVSINWTVNKEAAIDLYIQYGGLAQFEERVLDPRMRSAAKAAIAHFRADQIIRDRQTVVAEIQAGIVEVTQDLPINITMTQLEDIQLPGTYMESILLKEKAREDAEREKHALVQQKLVAQQTVQTADAKRDAIKSIADGQAYEVRVRAEAEAFRVLTEYNGRAEGVEALAAQLTPDYIAYVRAQTWNGVFPTHVLSEGAEVLLGLGVSGDAIGAPAATTAK